MAELKTALSELVFPEYEKEVEVKGLEDLVSKIPSKVKVEWLNEEKLKVLVDKLGAIQTEIKGALVSEVDQAPDKYQPIRRVRKVGNDLIMMIVIGAELQVAVVGRLSSRRYLIY